LEEQADVITEVPRDRFDIDAFYDGDPDAPGKTMSRWGGFLDQIDEFDAAFFGISPREAEHMDPQQRLLLEIAWEALENAGQPRKDLEGSATGVFVGNTQTEYAFLHGTTIDVIDSYSAPGTALGIVANRISYALDLRGPSMTVDTICSSSLL